MTDKELYRFEEGRKISDKIKHLEWALSVINKNGHYSDSELDIFVSEPRRVNSLSFMISELSSKYRDLHNECLRDMIRSLIAEYKKEFAKLFGAKAIVREVISVGSASKIVVHRTTGEVLHDAIKASDLHVHA